MQITINKFLDYVDSPEDSFQEYIEKANFNLGTSLI